jgi:hypothetical protein
MCGGDLDAEREGRTPVVVYGTVGVGAYGLPVVSKTVLKPFLRLWKLRRLTMTLKGLKPLTFTV